MKPVYSYENQNNVQKLSVYKGFQFGWFVSCLLVKKHKTVQNEILGEFKFISYRV